MGKFKIPKQKLNKYAQSAQAQLDLHGATCQEAEELLANFLTTAEAQGLSCVRVITGKGQHSANGLGVLSNFVKNYLQAVGYRFSEAKVNEGGSGALNIKLF